VTDSAAKPPNQDDTAAGQMDGPSSARLTFRWVDDPKGLEAVIAAASGAGAYALDTEFHRERTYYPQLALVQLAWGDGNVALIDPLAVDVAPLHALLRLDVPCIMHAASQDLPILERVCGMLPRTLIDTQVAAGFVGLGTPGLGALLERRLGISPPKADRLTDWLRRPLGSAAAIYAATDVAHLHDLWQSLEAELRRRGRLAWALEESEELRRRHGEPLDPDEAWWKIKDARRLKGRSRCVAQAVAAWREVRAQHVDKPARHVLPDLAVVAIASRPPASEADLPRVRGLEGRHLRGGVGRELLETIRIGREMPGRRLRLPDRNDVDAEHRPAVNLASAWVSQMARDLQIDASLLATRADIEALMAGNGSSRLLSGWREQVAGDQIRALLHGDAALAFAGNGALTLESRSRRPLGGP
jgi:ribonuclease D